MVGRSVSPRLFAGVVFSSIQLLILVVGFTYQADAEARCRGGSCRVQRFAPFQRFQPMRSCSGRSCGQPVMSSCGPRGCGQSVGGCGMRRVCGANGCSMVSSCGSGQSCGPNGCSTRMAGSVCGPNGCSTRMAGSVCGPNGCSTRVAGSVCGPNGCSTGGGISPAHAGAASLLGIGNEALSRGVSSGLGALQDQGTVQACSGGVNWYNRSRANWEPANICLSVNNQQLPIILNANGDLQLADQTGNLEPLSDNHARALAATYRKNGVKHDFMPALFQRYPEEANSTAVAQTEAAAPQPTVQGERNPASGLSETASTQPAAASKPTLVDLVMGEKNSDGTVKLDVAKSVQAMMAKKADILAAVAAGGRGAVTLMFSGATCGPCVKLKAAINNPASNEKLLQAHKINPTQDRLVIAIDQSVVASIPDEQLRNALMPYADENSDTFVASVPFIFGN